MTDRSVCTKDSPYRKGDRGLWSHPDARAMYSENDAGSYGGNYTRYKCPHCELEFEVEDADY